MEQLQLFENEFDQKFGQAYREGKTQPTNPENQFDDDSTPKELARQVVSATSAMQPKEMTDEELEAMLMLFGHHILDFINTIYPNGAPVNTRHKSALKLASDLMILLDGNERLVKIVLMKLSWVQDVVKERGEKEIDDIIDSAKKLLKKRESETLSDLRPSREMQRAIKQVVKREYSRLVAEARAQQTGNKVAGGGDIVATLDKMGREVEKLFKYYPLLRLACHGLQRKHYIAALFVCGAFCMNLMTRMWYRFWSAPGKKCRMNHLLELIGRQGSGKRFAVSLYEILMEPIKMADQAQIIALNNWKAEHTQNNGAAKNKTPEPKGIYRRLPPETSAAGCRDADANAKETIDGEEWYLHVCQFDSELQNTLSQMKKSYFSSLYTLWLKGFHNEPHGAFLKSTTSIVGEWPVHYNVVYTGTQHALDQQVNLSKYATGLNGRITAVPMGDSNFEMMENREYTDADRQRDAELSDWAYKLDATKGEIPCKDISDALHDWTARRMDDARENQSFADEDLLKRPCWHGINYALPYIVSRHWDMMVQDIDGRWKCGPDFKTDKIDRELALLICAAQHTFQQYFFGAIAEQHYENSQTAAASNHRLQQKTILAYQRLPDPFTSEDVMREYGYESVGSTCSRLKHLVDDGMAKKITKGEDKGKYRKLV